MVIQEQARVIIIVVALGCLIACAILICIFMWNLKRPSIVSYITTIMLFFVFVVLLVGSGLAKSGQTLSEDACLYAETYAANLLIDRIDDPGKRTWWKRAITFYINPERPPPDSPYSALNEVTGIDVTSILSVLQSPEVTEFLAIERSPGVQTVLNTALTNATVEAINNVTNLVQPLIQTSKCYIPKIVSILLLETIIVCFCFCMQPT